MLRRSLFRFSSSVVRNQSSPLVRYQPFQCRFTSTIPDIVEEEKGNNKPAYIYLFKKQLQHLRSTNNSESALTLFNEMKQSGLPIQCSLYQEVFLALISSSRFFQVENMYLEMRRDNIIPNIACFNVRLNALIACMDKAKEKGEMIFWLDKKLLDILEELDELNIDVNPRIYSSLLQLGSRGSVETLTTIWDKYCSLFPDEAPPPRTMSNTIYTMSERFEESASALKILKEAQEKYSYSAPTSLLSAICLRALATRDIPTALDLIKSIGPPSIQVYKNALCCSAQTGNFDLFEIAWPELKRRDLDLSNKLFPWALYTLAQTKGANAVIDAVCSAPPAALASIQLTHLTKIGSMLYDELEQIDNTFYYCEQKGEKICVQAFDLIIVSCGLLRDPIRAIETFQVLSDFKLEAEVSTYNAMMGVYLENEDFQIIPNVFGEMATKDLKLPNTDSYVSIIKAYIAMEEPQQVLRLLEEATTATHVLPFSLYEQIIRFFANQEDSSASTQFVIDRMKQLDLETNSLQQYVHTFPSKYNW